MELISLALTMALLAGPQDGRVEIEHRCLATNLYHEARGEPLEGQAATIQVALRRLDNNYRGARTMCDVVQSKGQFSWVATNKPELTEQQLLQSYRVLFTVLYTDIPDYSRGATHYFNPVTARDDPWIQQANITAQIGNHTFATL